MSNNKDKKILLVEDNEMHQFMYKFQLEQAGFGSVTVVATGQEGLEAAQNEKPALVLLDLILGGDHGLGGMEVLRRLKANEATKDIPVIVLSNKRAKDMAATVKEFGAVEYLLKADYVPREVVAYVERFFSK